MDLMLTGRRVAITGPAKGMGAAITRAFAEEGADLALFARDTAAVAPVAEEARARGVRAEILPCDVTDPARVEAAVAEANSTPYGTAAPRPASACTVGLGYLEGD